MGDNEIPVHFISEIKTKGYYVIDIKVFLPSLMRFLPQKGANFILTIDCETTALLLIVHCIGKHVNIVKTLQTMFVGSCY